MSLSSQPALTLPTLSLHRHPLRLHAKEHLYSPIPNLAPSRRPETLICNHWCVIDSQYFTREFPTAGAASPTNTNAHPLGPHIPGLFRGISLKTPHPRNRYNPSPHLRCVDPLDPKRTRNGYPPRNPTYSPPIYSLSTTWPPRPIISYYYFLVEFIYFGEKDFCRYLTVQRNVILFPRISLFWRDRVFPNPHTRAALAKLVRKSQ